MSFWSDTRKSWKRFWHGRFWSKPWRRRDDWLETYNREIARGGDNELIDLNNS